MARMQRAIAGLVLGFGCALAVQAFLREVEARGGEGVMLRAFGSPYTAGRSDHLRKHKSFDDTEAVVRGYKYRGLVGALVKELPDGTRFALGSGSPTSSGAIRRPSGAW